MARPDSRVRPLQGCHNDKSPTIGPEYKLDYENVKKDAKKLHAHVPLKHKH